MDGNGDKGIFIYDLGGNAAGKPLLLAPRGNAPLGKPNEGKPIDTSTIKPVQILGDWSDQPVNLKITKVTLGDVHK